MNMVLVSSTFQVCLEKRLFFIIYHLGCLKLCASSEVNCQDSLIHSLGEAVKILIKVTNFWTNSGQIWGVVKKTLNTATNASDNNSH